MHADGLGQVAVAVGVVGDQLADGRDDVEGEGIVRTAQRLPHLRELQHQRLATGLENSVDFLQGYVLVGHVAQAEGQRDAVEVFVGEWQPLGIALHGGQRQAAVERPVTAHVEHGGVDVGHPHLHAGLAGHGTGQVPAAGGQIEHPHAGTQCRLPHREMLPDSVQTAGHQVVHQVVAAGHGVEHAAHPAGLFGGIDLLVTKVGFLLGVGHGKLLKRRNGLAMRKNGRRWRG